MNKIGKIIARTGTFVVALGLALVGAYALTPTKTRTITLNSGVDHEQIEEGNTTDLFTKFLNNFVQNVGITGDNDGTNGKSIYGLKVQSDDLTLKFTTGNSTYENVINLGLDVDFLMRGLKDINFNLALDVDYDNYQLPLQVSYVGKTAYFGLDDLRIKCSSSTIDDLLTVIDQFFVYGEDEVAEGETQGGLGLDIYNKVYELEDILINNLLGSVDLSNMTSALDQDKLEEEGLHLKHETITKDDHYEFDLEVIINKLEEKEVEGEVVEEMKKTSIPLTIFTDKSDDMTIQKVVLGPMTFGSLTVSGTIKLDFVKDMQIYSPEDELYAKYDANYEYVEVLAYKGWIKKLADFLNENNQKFTLDFSVDLSHDTKNDNDEDITNEIGNINGSITADFSELIDLTSWKKAEEPEEDDSLIGHNPTTNNNSNNNQNDDSDDRTTIQKILDKTSFGIDINLDGQNGNRYANLSVRYVDGDGYLNFNENVIGNETKSVIKAKVEAETINWLIDKAPEMLATLATDETTTQEEAETAEDSLFSFITDSTFVKGIKNGNYSVIMGLIKNISNDNEKINLDIDLSSIGLGNNSSIGIVLDGSMDSNKEIITVKAENIEFGSFNVGLEVKNNTSFGKDITLSDYEKSTYESVSFLPTVFDQVSSILESKQAAFAVSGSLLDNNELGVRFSGDAQFDYGDKYGFGQLQIDQYKYHNNKVWYSHKIALDVDNQGQDYTENNARFIYGDPNTTKNMKGRFTIKTFLDVFDVIKTFIKDNKNDSKFTKFIAPLLETLGLGQISDILKSEDYLRFAKNDILKEIKQYDNGNSLRITVGGAFFNLGSDIVLEVKFVSDEDGNRTIDSINIPNLKLGQDDESKTLNLSINLNEYDENKTSIVNKNDDFMNLSDIAVLLELGINTTKMSYYQLSAVISLNALLIINLDFNIKVHIVVDGKNVKIYGVIEDSKLSSIAQDYNILTNKGMKSEFTFHTDSSLGNDVGGYFDFKRTMTERERVGFLQYENVDHYYHYKTTSSNLLDGDNLLTYLLVDFLGVKASLLEQLGSLDLSSDEEKEAGEFTNLFTDTGFVYTASSKTLKTGINLNEITGIDALRELELTISGKTIKDEEGNDIDVLSKAVVDLKVKASLVTITIGANISLVNPSLTEKNWNTTIDNAYKGIAEINFPESIINDPNSYYKL